MNDKPTCGVAFVGAGYMAREHARAFQSIPGVRLAGIHSRTRSRAEALASEFGIGNVCDSVAELHEHTGAELVVVSVPELTMRETSERCFAYPWHVLLEKPAGHMLAEARAIAAAAARRPLPTHVALNRRFYQATMTARTDLQERTGARFIVVQDQQDQSAASAAGQPEAVVRNWMFANSIHTIDYLRVFGRGAISAVRPVVTWKPERPGIVVSQIEFDSGDIGLYQGVWDGPGPWAVAVTTRDVRWELRPLESAAFQRRGERRLTAIAPNSIDEQFKPGLRLQAEHAVAAVQGRPHDSVTIDDALNSMELVHRIFGLDDVPARTTTTSA